MKNKNLWVLCGIAAVIALAFAAAAALGGFSGGGSLYAVITPANGEKYAVRLPDDAETEYSVRQTLADGTETENVLILRQNGFFMQSSTCPHGDCVKQGEVTAENRERRALRNAVICLPNRLIVELCTESELPDGIREELP